MMPDPLMRELNAMRDHLTQLQANYDAMKQWLDREKPGWDKGATGTSGSLTVSEPVRVIGSLTPNSKWGMNVREIPSLKGEKRVNYAFGGDVNAIGIVDGLDGDGYRWYEIEDAGFIREDVVTFTPINTTPINAAIWPAPVMGYTITNHDGHSHDGLDYACDFGTRIQSGPNGGYVVKAFTCQFCNPHEGDGKASLQDPGKAFGYGSHVIVRYAYDTLPQAVKNAIPNGAYVYAIYAHLSKALVSQGQTLESYQLIGEVGATGNTYGINGGDPSHLHFSLRWSTHPDAGWAGMSNNRINPTLLVKA